MGLRLAMQFTETEQERYFLLHDCENNLGKARFCYATGAFLWAAFGLLDIFVAQESLDSLVIVRYCLGFPVLVLAFFASFIDSWQRRLKEIGLFVTLICGGCIIAMDNILPPTSRHGYFVGLILVLMYSFSFGQLTFNYAILSGFGLTFVFVVTEFSRARLPIDVFLSKSAFLMAAVYIGLFCCGTLEHHRRRDFSSSREMRRKNRRLRSLARALQDESTHDELTGLLNRRQLRPVFDQLLAKLIASGVESTFMLIDLDSFKRVNDMSGHLVGDEILKEVANVLRSTVGSVSSIFRIGGDEFVIALPGISRAQINDYISQIIDAFYCWKETNNTARCAHLGISIGHAEIRSNRDTLEDVLKRADNDLYVSKRKGILPSKLLR
jgi:diguanylate cyclase (GGDEF)-like protein